MHSEGKKDSEPQSSQRMNGPKRQSASQLRMSRGAFRSSTFPKITIAIAAPRYLTERFATASDVFAVSFSLLVCAEPSLVDLVGVVACLE